MFVFAEPFSCAHLLAVIDMYMSAMQIGGKFKLKQISHVSVYKVAS